MQTKYNTYTQQRRRDLTLFQPKAYAEQLQDLTHMAKEASQKFLDVYSNLCMEYINKMPQQDRDLASAYALQILGQYD